LTVDADVVQAYLRQLWAKTFKHNTHSGRIPPFTSAEANPNFKWLSLDANACFYLATIK